MRIARYDTGWLRLRRGHAGRRFMPASRLPVSGGRSSGQEPQKHLVELVGVGPEEPMGGTFDLDVLGAGKSLGERAAGGVDRQDVVGRAVHDKRGHIDLGYVGTEVGQPGELCRDGCVRRGVRGDIPTRAERLFAEPVAQVSVRVEEVLEEVGEECVTVVRDGRQQPVEYLLRNTGRVVLRLQEEWSK